MADIILIAGLTVIGFVILYFVLKKRLLDIINPQSMITEIRKEVNEVILELNRTTERNIGLIEDKINNISDLLTRADKRILLLQREGEKLNITRSYNDIIKKDKPPSPPVTSNEVEKPWILETKSLSNQEKVMRLHKDGLSPNLIANRLNIPAGEVELIISLNDRG